MIKLLVSFLITFLIVTFGITLFRNLSGAEKWAFTKTLFYGIIVSVVSVVILTTIVILF